MNNTFRLWEYTGVDSIYDVGIFVKELTKYIKIQTTNNLEVILDIQKRFENAEAFLKNKHI